MRRARKRTKIEDIALDMQCTAELMPGPEDVVPDSQILAAMEEIQDLEEKDRDGRTLLSNAACYGRAETVKYLLKRGADVRTTDECGFTALHFAVQCGNEEIVALLIEAGADVNAPVKYLLKRGADVRTTDECGFTALHFAVQCGNEEIVALLIEAGADVNAQNQWGNVPLSMGNRKTPMGIYSLLMQHGADPTIKNDYGVSMDEIYPFLTEMKNQIDHASYGKGSTLHGRRIVQTP